MLFTADREQKHDLLPEEYEIMEIPQSKRKAQARYIATTAARETVVGYGKHILEMALGGHGIWFVGASVTGKSSAAVALGKLYRQHKFYVYYTSLHDLRDNVRKRKPWEDNETSPVEKSKVCEVLILDDVTVEDLNRQTGMLNYADLHALLHYRHENDLVTLLATTIPTGVAYKDFLRSVPIEFLQELEKKDIIISLTQPVPSATDNILKIIHSK